VTKNHHVFVSIFDYLTKDELERLTSTLGKITGFEFIIKNEIKIP